MNCALARCSFPCSVASLLCTVFMKRAAPAPPSRARPCSRPPAPVPGPLPARVPPSVALWLAGCFPCHLAHRRGLCPVAAIIRSLVPQMNDNDDNLDVHLPYRRLPQQPGGWTFGVPSAVAYEQWPTTYTGLPWHATPMWARWQASFDDDPVMRQLGLYTGLPQAVLATAAKADRQEEAAPLLQGPGPWTAGPPTAPELSAADDRIVLWRLSSGGADIASAILRADSLASAMRRVVDADCELMPRWAKGAILLVPMTREQLDCYGWQLQSHHVVSMLSDRDNICQAIRGLRRRKKPSLEPDPQANGALSLAADTPQGLSPPGQVVAASPGHAEKPAALTQVDVLCSHAEDADRTESPPAEPAAPMTRAAAWLNGASPPMPRDDPDGAQMNDNDPATPLQEPQTATLATMAAYAGAPAEPAAPASRRQRKPRGTSAPRPAPLDPTAANERAPAHPLVQIEGIGALFELCIRRAKGRMLGLSFNQCDDDLDGLTTLRIRGVSPGSAADAWNKQCSGGPKDVKSIRAGDRILRVNNEYSITGMLGECAQSVLVRLLIVRGNFSRHLLLTVTAAVAQHVRERQASAASSSGGAGTGEAGWRHAQPAPLEVSTDADIALTPTAPHAAAGTPATPWNDPYDLLTPISDEFCADARLGEYAWASGFGPSWPGWTLPPLASHMTSAAAGDRGPPPDEAPPASPYPGDVLSIAEEPGGAAACCAGPPSEDGDLAQAIATSTTYYLTGGDTIA